MSELRISNAGEGLSTFFMDSIMVDGIFTVNNRIWGSQIFTMKMDYWDSEEECEVDGYIDDTDEDKSPVAWDSPYSPVPNSLGEIDLDYWMEEGVVRVIRQYS